MNKKIVIVIVLVICAVVALYILLRGNSTSNKLEVPANFVESTEKLVGSSTIESMPKAQKDAFIKNTEALIGTTTIDTLPTAEKDAFIKAVEALKAQ